MNDKTIIHIGYAKGGSTLMQNQIFRTHPNYVWGNKDLELLCELSHKHPSKNIIDHNLETRIKDPQLPGIISHEHFLLPFSNDEIIKNRTVKLGLNNGYIYNKNINIKTQLKNIKSYLPHPKILLVLRKQEDIILSEYAHRLRDNVKPWNTAKKFEDYVQITYKSKLYHNLINHLYDTFGKKNVLVILLEELVSEPEKTLAVLGEFMEYKFMVDIKQVNKGIYNFREIKRKRIEKRIESLKNESFFINKYFSEVVHYRLLQSGFFDALIDFRLAFTSKKQLHLPENREMKKIMDQFRYSNRITNELLDNKLKQYNYYLVTNQYQQK
jgi:hypothetical protein